MISITETEFIKLSRLIESLYGIHLKSEKKSLIIGRLQNELIKKNFDSFTEYYNYVMKDKTGIAFNELINKISTNHTYFLRENDHFKYFSEKVLPYFEENNRENSLRIWSAGCSSGEEPYTLSMILNDFLGKKKVWSEAKILATDISDKVLDKAKLGIYPRESVSVLPNTWKLNYLSKINHDQFVFHEDIRANILFKKFNLMDQFPFKRKFHTIFCRNVMIYFNNKTRTELVRKFYETTETGGYLFIGQSESIIRNETDYKYIMPSVYRKI